MPHLSPFRRSSALLAAGLLACSTHSSPAPSPTPASSRAAEPSTAARLGIPPGHLPPPGLCRIWRPGRPPGHQTKAGVCSALEREAPAGSWVVFRPTRDKKVVYVREVDPRRAGVVVRVRVFEAASGEFVREEKP